MEERFNKLLDILKNEEQANRLLQLTAEEAVATLKAEFGLEFTEDELKDIYAGILAYERESKGEELGESDLEQVAGGGKGSEAYQFGKSAGKAGVVIVCIGIVAFGW